MFVLILLFCTFSKPKQFTYKLQKKIIFCANNRVAHLKNIAGFPRSNVAYGVIDHWTDCKYNVSMLFYVCDGDNMAPQMIELRRSVQSLKIVLVL